MVLLFKKKNCVARKTNKIIFYFDISLIEQIFLWVRFIDKYCIREDFLEFVSIYDVSGKGLTFTTTRQMEKLGLKTWHLIVQGFDRTNVMSGFYNGVHKLIRDKIPYMLYVYCAAHSL